MNRDEQDDLKVKKAWEIAIGPAKTYLPQLFDFGLIEVFR